MEKEIEFKKLYFRSFRQIEDFYNKMKIGTIVKWENNVGSKLGIYMGGNIQFAVLEIAKDKSVKECVDNLLLNSDIKVKFENIAAVLLSTYVCFSEYRQEELLLWCMKKKLLLKSEKVKSSYCTFRRRLMLPNDN